MVHTGSCIVHGTLEHVVNTITRFRAVHRYGRVIFPLMLVGPCSTPLGA